MSKLANNKLWYLLINKYSKRNFTKPFGLNKYFKEVHINQKFKTKDLVLIGIFAVIYFVIMFGVGMMGIVPILFLAYPFVLGLTGGIISMLVMAKAQKPWITSIFGMIAPIIMFVGGHTYVIIINSLIVMILVEIIRRSGNYHDIKKDTLANGVFNMWICGSLMQMLLMHDEYMAMTVPTMGQEYADKLEALITYPNMAIVYLIAFIGGILGAIIAKKLLRKHFEKAGLI